jgi:hypothetical protein
MTSTSGDDTLAGARRLGPVGPLTAAGDPEAIHLAVLTFDARQQVWRHGSALCDRLPAEGELDGDTTVTCPACEAWRPRFETALAHPARDRGTAEDGWEFAEQLERDNIEWARTGWRLNCEVVRLRAELGEVRASASRTSSYLWARLDAQAAGLPIPEYPEDPTASMDPGPRPR